MKMCLVTIKFAVEMRRKYLIGFHCQVKQTTRTNVNVIWLMLCAWHERCVPVECRWRVFVCNVILRKCSKWHGKLCYRNDFSVTRYNIVSVIVTVELTHIDRELCQQQQQQQHQQQLMRLPSAWYSYSMSLVVAVKTLTYHHRLLAFIIKPKSIDERWNGAKNECEEHQNNDAYNCS